MPWRELEGRFGDKWRYALPRNVPQKAVQAEVRGRVGGGMCPAGSWKAGSRRHGVTHFREMRHRRQSRPKCVEGWEEECALEGAGRLLRGGTALRTSAKCATEGSPGRSAWEGRRRNVPCRELEGRFAVTRRYALPRNVPQRAVQAEVRGRVEGGMCPGGSWKAASCFACARKCTGPPAGDARKAGLLEVRAGNAVNCREWSVFAQSRAGNAANCREWGVFAQSREGNAANCQE